MADRLILSREEYRAVYLQSDHWRQQRVAALERADHRCQVCNAPKSLDVHHRTYERLGAELPTDLTVLCRDCHSLFHGSAPKPQSKPRPPRQRQQQKKQKKPKRSKQQRQQQRQTLRDSLEEMRARNAERPLRMSDYGAAMARLDAEQREREKAKPSLKKRGQR